MQKCSDCNGELLEDLDLFAQGVYQVGISQGKTLNQSNNQSRSMPKLRDSNFLFAER